MSAIEQKFIALFSPLPLSLKAKIVATLSQLIAKETEQPDDEFLQEDLQVSEKVRNLVAEGKMDVYSEEEYWSKLKSS